MKILSVFGYSLSCKERARVRFLQNAKLVCYKTHFYYFSSTIEIWCIKHQPNNILEVEYASCNE